ncbi:MAG: TIGR03620 family F420-dependent LLM class oxidoreductase [SAR324 cluster bacterium]|nr:TIGR03620 family F420-dependent LLM class oxidoreductase [SAR324 cluster bacterium]
MELGKLGVFCFLDSLTPDQLKELAQHTEKLGYGALWYPEARGHESFSMGSFLLSQTESLIVATGIANIYARDATAAKQGQHTMVKLYGDRFLLGLGVSHIPMVENARGHIYGKPVASMRAYLDSMDKAAAIAPPLEEAPPIVLAALGPNMTKLAGERTAGALPYNITPQHTAWARKIVGPGPWICAEQKVLRVKDPVKARGLARQMLAPYMALPNYSNNWLRLGFNESDFADGGSDRFMDAMVAWGDDATIQQRIQEHFDAGASHVCIQPLHPEGQRLPDLEALEALAP